MVFRPLGRKVLMRIFVTVAVFLIGVFAFSAESNCIEAKPTSIPTTTSTTTLTVTAINFSAHHQIVYFLGI